MSRLGLDAGLILVPACPRAAWIAEKIRSHPTLADVPLVGYGEPRDFDADAWLAWPLEPEAAQLVLHRWLAESTGRQALAWAGRLLERVLDAVRLMNNPLELERNLELFMRQTAELFDAQSCALLLMGKNEREVFIVASTELAKGVLVPLDEAAAVALQRRVKEGVALALEEPGGDTLLALALERDSAAGLERSLTFPVPIAGAAVGGILVGVGPSLPYPRRQLLAAGQLLAHQAGAALHGSALLMRVREQTKRVTLDQLADERRDRSMRQYQEFFESSSDGVILLDEKARVLHINRTGAQMTGYAASYLVGRPLAEIVSEHHREGLEEIVQSAVKGVPLRNFDLLLETTSEDIITVAVSSSSLKLDKVAIVFTFRDVSEARALENELINTKEFLERLIASAVDAIVAADSLDGQIILFNRGAENLFGRSADDTVGKARLEDLFPEEEYEDLLRQLRSPHFGGEGRLEQSHKHARDADGQHVPVSMTASIIADEQQEVALVAIITDLREQIQIQERLAMTQERLEVTEKQALIAELAGTTAHELNQPLTSVMGYAELLKKKLGEESPHAHAMGVIMQEAGRMAEIVRKIGKITRYETKSYVGTTQILDLERAAEE
ncbi:MAG: PAS domain S-box protein [bacterium]